MRLGTVRVAFVAAATASAACSLLFGVSDDAASGKRPSEDAAIDGASAGDATPDVPVPCPPSTEGPKLVRAGSYCIDSTEVTVADYGRYLEAGLPPFTDAAQCINNATSALVLINDAEPPPDFPVFVDYCDAVAFCLWAGKRLCGGLDGGRAEADAGGQVFDNQWQRACRGPNGLLFPYGTDLIPDACPPPAGVGSTYPGYYEATAVGTHPLCEGGYPGLFDMVGNGYEWVDACMSELGCGVVGVDDCKGTGGRIVTGVATFRCCSP
jgi:formylglycine-generating enzyme